ncbi:M56 family metallopeptidase [Pigmentiphaga daeguensis]|uniref:Peptidase M48 domain-containing protein n=1 Tax=Pigmentiphaga daeguensis TaxID=414049 RepID=A0ABN1CYL9_9BURK
MTSYGPLLQFALLSGFVLAVTLTLLIGACEHPLRRALSGRTPSQRARISWWALVTPALAGIAYVLMALAMPSMFEGSARFAAACSAHADTLLHLCVSQPSGNSQSAWLWGALALLVGYAAWLATRAAAGLWRARRTLASLVRLSRRPGHPERLRVLDVDRPMALACGIGHGHILLSTLLMRQLDPTQLRVVLAHEQAHITNRDVLLRLVAAVLSSIQLPSTRRRLLRDLELALEQRCDFAAANEVGCRVAVAETIVAMEKIYRQHAREQAPFTMAFFSDFVPERVEALLSPKQSSVSYLGLMLGILVLAFCSLSVGWLHSATESFITMMPR